MFGSGDSTNLLNKTMQCQCFGVSLFFFVLASFNLWNVCRPSAQLTWSRVSWQHRSSGQSYWGVRTRHCVNQIRLFNVPGDIPSAECCRDTCARSQRKHSSKMITALPPPAASFWAFGSIALVARTKLMCHPYYYYYCFSFTNISCFARRSSKH